MLKELMEQEGDITFDNYSKFMEIDYSEYLDMLLSEGIIKPMTLVKLAPKFYNSSKTLFCDIVNYITYNNVKGFKDYLTSGMDEDTLECCCYINFETQHNDSFFIKLISIRLLLDYFTYKHKDMKDLVKSLIEVCPDNYHWECIYEKGYDGITPEINIVESAIRPVTGRDITGSRSVSNLDEFKIIQISSVYLGDF